MAVRSTARDGLANRLETYATTHFEPLWDAVQRVPPVRRRVNRVLINRAILKMPTRPNPLSTKADYTSWDSLTDRRFDSRHLPPAPPRNGPRPDVERVADLFARSGDGIPCEKSTVLFAYFAAWFTDGFLRSDRSEPRDMRKNDSNHEIDLTQLYGVREAETRLLRTFAGGRLKSQTINGEEYPPFLCQGGAIKPEFHGLTVVRFDQLSAEQRDGLFAMGSDTSNLQLGFTMLGVLFLREHNRLADALAREHPGWDDERLFGTARNILTVLLIKIVVDEYINHIAPYHFKFFTDPASMGNEPWMRPNWMAVEFNLLYRWHSMVPSAFRIDGQDVPIGGTLFNNELVTRRGLGPLFEDATDQPACRVGLFNTHPYLREAEIESLRQAREVRLASYNDYRELCRFPRVTNVDQISSDQRVRAGLRELYGHVDEIEFFVGLFAEDRRPNSVLPSLIGRMVGIDAFSQAFTNPLLAPRVYNAATFSSLGLDVIRTTRRLSDIVHRNLPDRNRRYRVSMTRSDWTRV